MKVTFLGTGTSQGIPIIGNDHPVCLSTNKKDKRLRVSVLIEWDDYAYVVDCGPDFRYQMLRANINRIDGIVFTHEHSDHTSGIDELRPFFYKQGAIPIYAEQRVFKQLEKRFFYLFDENNEYLGKSSVIKNHIENKAFMLHNLEVIPIRVMHSTLEIFGYRFNNFAYLTDIKTISNSEIEKLQNLDVLVVTALRIKPHPSHFNLEEALEFIKIVKPKRAYLTHISHLLGFHDEVQQNLPENVFLAYDNLELNI